MNIFINYELGADLFCVKNGKNKKAEVSALAKELDISQVTLRKDLDELEQAFIVKREHGYAQLTSIDSIAGRLAYHFEEKTAIAPARVSTIEITMAKRGLSIKILENMSYFASCVSVTN